MVYLLQLLLPFVCTALVRGNDIDCNVQADRLTIIDYFEKGATVNRTAFSFDPS